MNDDEYKVAAKVINLRRENEDDIVADVLFFSVVVSGV